MRLGIFGGTFDPPHNGHLLAASDAFEALHLDRLILVPAKEQPFKAGAVLASPAHRLQMLGDMVDGDQRFTVDAMEIERPGVSFTVDTLAAFAERHADAHLCFLIGEDLVGQFASWREPERIAALAEIVVLSRTSDAPKSPFTMRQISTRRIDLSSTEIRARVREGRSIRGFVPDVVAQYIAATRLYR
ncbi:MAG: nicotinate (nicotinamide) nucleotide adenylyltransferase [Anaerolineae bacterium]|nr:nicotinate (nicotinamide) nucleotide adenylyltransferase [Gemmatimonadaceae bacterium]